MVQSPTLAPSTDRVQDSLTLSKGNDAQLKISHGSHHLLDGRVVLNDHRQFREAICPHREARGVRIK